MTWLGKRITKEDILHMQPVAVRFRTPLDGLDVLYEVPTLSASGASNLHLNFVACNIVR